MAVSGSRCMQFGEITPREIRFCEEYVKDFNGTAAAKRANLGAENSCKQIAHQYLKKPHVREYVRELQMRISERCEVEADDLIRYWLSVMNNPGERTSERTKASICLARTLGIWDHVQKDDKPPVILYDLEVKALPEGDCDG